MKVIQVLPCLNYGDAIGNDTLALNTALINNGYDACVFAEAVDQKIPVGVADTMDHWHTPEKDDVIIYHLSVGWDYIDRIIQAPCRKIAIYHNVTPAHFFKPYDASAYEYCKSGLEEVKKLKDTFDYCLADSQFNKQDLIDYGYKCQIDVLPILIPFDDYKKTPSAKVLKEQVSYKGNRILFLGRVVPNKRIDELLRIFAYYQKYFDDSAVLNLVGMYNFNDVYYRQLRDYQKKLNLKHVNFTGHVKFNEILAYYRTADAFLCASDHEGFCVPLVESMYFGIPIIAKDTTAVGDTLGGSGFLIKEENDLEIAAALNRVLNDKKLKEQIINSEKKRLLDFDNKKVENRFIELLENFLKS